MQPAGSRRGRSTACRFLRHLVTVTNPMTSIIIISVQRPAFPGAVIGFGGQLDSARFGIALRNRDITATLVLGEHGEHQVPSFQASPAGSRMEYGRISFLNSGCKYGGDQGKAVPSSAGLPPCRLIRMVSWIPGNSRSVQYVSKENMASPAARRHPGRYRERGIRKIGDWALDAWSRRRWIGPAGSHRPVQEACPDVVAISLTDACLRTLYARTPTGVRIAITRSNTAGLPTARLSISSGGTAGKSVRINVTGFRRIFTYGRPAESLPASSHYS